MRRSELGPVLEIEGLQVINDFRTFAGDPSPALLADPRVLIEGCAGRQWPGSFADLASGGHMQRDAVAGRWPNQKERDAQARATAKFNAAMEA